VGVSRASQLTDATIGAVLVIPALFVNYYMYIRAEKKFHIDYGFGSNRRRDEEEGGGGRRRDNSDKGLKDMMMVGDTGRRATTAAWRTEAIAQLAHVPNDGSSCAWTCHHSLPVVVSCFSFFLPRRMQDIDKRNSAPGRPKSKSSSKSGGGSSRSGGSEGPSAKSTLDSALAGTQPQSRARSALELTQSGSGGLAKIPEKHQVRRASSGGGGGGGGGGGLRQRTQSSERGLSKWFPGNFLGRSSSSSSSGVVRFADERSPGATAPRKDFGTQPQPLSEKPPQQQLRVPHQSPQQAATEAALQQPQQYQLTLGSSTSSASSGHPSMSSAASSAASSFASSQVGRSSTTDDIDAAVSAPKSRSRGARAWC